MLVAFYNTCFLLADCSSDHFPLIPSVADADNSEMFRLIPDCKPRKPALLGGSGGMPPQKSFEILKNSYL